MAEYMCSDASGDIEAMTFVANTPEEAVSLYVDVVRENYGPEERPMTLFVSVREMIPVGTFRATVQPEDVRSPGEEASENE